MTAIMNGTRPEFPSEHRNHSANIVTLIESGWHDDPFERPDCFEFLASLTKHLECCFSTSQPYSDDTHSGKLYYKSKEKEKEKEKEQDKHKGKGKRQEKTTYYSIEEQVVKQVQAILEARIKAPVNDTVPISDEGNVIERHIQHQERCESVEQWRNIVAIQEYDEVGTVTCMVSTSKHISFGHWSSFFSNTYNSSVIGGTSRGFLVCWNDEVNETMPL